MGMKMNDLEELHRLERMHKAEAYRKAAGAKPLPAKERPVAPAKKVPAKVVPAEKEVTAEEFKALSLTQKCLIKMKTDDLVRAVLYMIVVVAQGEVMGVDMPQCKREGRHVTMEDALQKSRLFLTKGDAFVEKMFRTLRSRFEDYGNREVRPHLKDNVN